MNIHTTEGHLTPTEKRVICVMLERGLSEAKSGRKSYRIEKGQQEYTVRISQNDRGLIPCGGSQLRLSCYTHKFTIG